MKNVLVIGATGPLGIQVINRAIDSGYRVTALVRRNNDVLRDFASIRIVQGDVLDPATLRKAMHDQHAVICVFGTKLTRKPTTLLSTGTRNLIDAMSSTGIKRFICVTGVGAGESKHHGGFVYDNILEPFLLHEIYKDKTRQEEVIKRSDLDWVIARPAMMTNGPATGTALAVTDLDGFSASSISRRDVAEFLVSQIERDEFVHRAPVLTRAA